MKFFQWKRFKCKGSVLISTIIAGALIGILGIGCSRLMGAVMNAANATHIATQAEQYAKAQGGLLRGTEYKNLAAVAKKNITSDGDFKYEITMGAESDYDASTKQRIMTVNVYHDTDTAPIYSLDVPRYSKEVGGAEDYIVEQWHSGSEWYRVWKSGFIEQGGIATSSNGVASSSGKSGSRTYTFRKPFRDANYTITCSPHERKDTSDDSHEGIFNLTKTNFSLLQLDYGSIRWRAEGY